MAAEVLGSAVQGVLRASCKCKGQGLRRASKSRDLRLLPPQNRKSLQVKARQGDIHEGATAVSEPRKPNPQLLRLCEFGMLRKDPLPQRAG